MDILGTTRLIALLGDPVSHSLSPAMHNPAFVQNGIDFAYVPLRVKTEDLSTAVEALRVFNFRGANVTLPHKQAIMPFLDEISDLSRLIGAVNTIVNHNGRLIGTTTDPDGFLEAYREMGLTFAGQAIAILGNGGSARTLAFTLLTQDVPSRVVLVGRDKQKTQRLADEITETLNKPGSHFSKTKLEMLETCTFADYGRIAPEIQIVVNATPVGMHPNSEFSPLATTELHTGQIIYDIVYVPEQTRLIRDAQALGLKTVGGLGMLVHQGRASFELWTGTKPEASQFFASARDQLSRNGRPDDHKTTQPSGIFSLTKI
jgi:shikimate dehydrogenase